MFSLVFKHRLLQLEDFIVAGELFSKINKKRRALVIPAICQHATGIRQTLRSFLVRLIFLGGLQQTRNLVIIGIFLPQFDEKLDALHIILLRPQAARLLHFLEELQSLLALCLFVNYL